MSRHIHIKRYRQIVTIFVKNGFGLFLDQLGVLNYLKIRRKITAPGAKKQHSRFSVGERFRMSLEELGPAFVKLGQLLSTRSDLFPAEITEELKKLQDSVPPFPFDEAKALIEAELNSELEEIFMLFDETPLASASISQVYLAQLKSTQKVAVKVQRPNIAKVINLDVLILKDLAHFLDNHTRFGKIYDFTIMANEFETTINSELDFTREAENSEIFTRNFKNDESIKVPAIKSDFSTSKVLTMEYVQGIRIDDRAALLAAGISSHKVAEVLAGSVLNQILRDGFFHADPHPGNLMVLPDGTIVLLDLGMVGHLSETRRRIISNFFIGVATKDSRMVVKSIMELDTASKRSNLKLFERNIDVIIDKYLTLPWNKIKIGELFRDIFRVAAMHHVKIPREFTMISKTLATLQSLVEVLAPDLNYLEIAEPIARKMIHQSINIKSIRNDFKRSFFNFRELFSEFPSVMLNFLGRMEDGDFAVQFEIKDIEKIEQRLDRALNRISISLVLLAVSIIIAGVVIASSLSAGTSGEMYKLNEIVLKLSLTAAALIIAWLVFSIIRSARK